jgi:hypothetical protein
MQHFAGLDVSVKETSICIVDATGTVGREVKVASEPEALLRILKDPAYRFERIGLEAGPLSQWLIWGIARQASLDLLHSHTRDPDGGREAGLVARGRDQCRGGARSLPRDRPAASTHIRSDP